MTARAQPMCRPQGSTAALPGRPRVHRRRQLHGLDSLYGRTHRLRPEVVMWAQQHLHCRRPAGGRAGGAWGQLFNIAPRLQRAHKQCSRSSDVGATHTAAALDLNQWPRPSGLRGCPAMLNASAGSHRPTMRAVGRLALPVLSSGRAAAAAAAASSQVRSPPLWAKLPCSAPALSVFCRRSSKAACQSRTARHLQGARHLTVTAASAEGQAAQKDPAQTLLDSVEHELKHHCCNLQGDRQTFDQYLVRRHWRQPCMLGRTHRLVSLHASMCVDHRLLVFVLLCRPLPHPRCPCLTP